MSLVARRRLAGPEFLETKHVTALTYYRDIYGEGDLRQIAILLQSFSFCGNSDVPAHQRRSDFIEVACDVPGFW